MHTDNTFQTFPFSVKVAVLSSNVGLYALSLFRTQSSLLCNVRFSLETAVIRYSIFSISLEYQSIG